MLTCGSNRNRSTPSNFCAVDLGRGRQIEHRVELDRRLAVAAFADDAGPGGVVEFGEVVLRMFANSQLSVVRIDSFSFASPIFGRFLCTSGPK